MIQMKAMTTISIIGLIEEPHEKHFLVLRVSNAKISIISYHSDDEYTNIIMTLIVNLQFHRFIYLCNYVRTNYVMFKV